jgi:uncharacterized protein
METTADKPVKLANRRAMKVTMSKKAKTVSSPFAYVLLGALLMGAIYWGHSSWAELTEHSTQINELARASAMTEIAYQYQTGAGGVTQDYAKAMDWYQKAAALGDPDALKGIGWLYSSGLGVPQDYTEAMKWYEKAADAGSAAAMNNIGWMYQNAWGVSQDLSEAIVWYKKAAEPTATAPGGFAEAMYNLGNLYLSGPVGVADTTFRRRHGSARAPRRGIVNSMTNYGVLLILGQGVAQNYTEAINWLMKSAAAGNKGAMTWLGDCYSRGIGVAMDMQAARAWYKKAADAGDPDAQKWLADNPGN